MGIPLSVLEGRFVRLQGEYGSYREEPTIESADGISFVCPLCFLAAKDDNYDPKVGVRGVHHVLCWRPRVPVDTTPGPGRWDLRGTGLHDVTLVSGSSSIQLIGGCAWHGYVRNGECVDDLGPDSVERARAYQRSWKQSIIDREIKTMAQPTETAAATLTDKGETKPLPDATKPAEVETGTLPGATGGASGETTDTTDTDEDAPHPVPVVVPAGYVKTMDLRVNGAFLEQRWVSGHDARQSVWVPIDGQ